MQSPRKPDSAANQGEHSGVKCNSVFVCVHAHAHTHEGSVRQGFSEELAFS